LSPSSQAFAISLSHTSAGAGGFFWLRFWIVVF
jgi:hypothetical protein